DSAANGPRARALVEEFIPALERQFRLVRRPEARIVTGHSSGGWSALWLQLTHPETFGACFPSTPDPVDFSRSPTSDLSR
ncbi:MAG: alpha/beta hydrolase-fold protein, partial [Phycisphaerales bacterium]